MKFIPIISSILLMGSLASADDGIQFLSLEVPSVAGKEATLKVVLRGTDGAEAPSDEILVVEIVDSDNAKKPLATITIQPGQSSGLATIDSKHLDSDAERSQLKGRLRLGDTGLLVGELIPTPAATAVAN